MDYSMLLLVLLGCPLAAALIIAVPLLVLVAGLCVLLPRRNR